LIAHTIETARVAEVFDEIIVSTDDNDIARIALQWGATVPCLRPSELAQDNSPDIDWVLHAVDQMVSVPLEGKDVLAILRPTSPLRTSPTIVSALKTFLDNDWADSLRAMELTDKHPGKMWKIAANNEATPYLSQKNRVVPTHDSPTQSLEAIWIQNASLEMTRMRSLLENRTISGERILAFEMPGNEGLDLNTENDWRMLEALLA